MRGALPRRLTRRMPNYDQEDSVVDFNDASLYLPLAQTVFSICACAVVSVLSCWLAPNGAVSAVRTLALCSATAAAHARAAAAGQGARHLRRLLGAAAGDPAVPRHARRRAARAHVQHGRVARAELATRVFHSAVLAMVYAGFMRARAPLEDTDRPFIITVARVHASSRSCRPPAVALCGPLCQAVDLWEAADRIVRAFCFGIALQHHRVRQHAHANTQLLEHVDRLLSERVGLASGSAGRSSGGCPSRPRSAPSSCTRGRCTPKPRPAQAVQADREREPPPTTRTSRPPMRPRAQVGRPRRGAGPVAQRAAHLRGRGAGVRWAPS